MFEIPSKIKMKHRKFRYGERVFVCDYESQDNVGFGVLVSVDYTPKKNVLYGGSVAGVVLESTGEKVEVFGHKVYKIAPRISQKVGEVVCYEHNIFERGHNYPFYIPNNDENYYRFELGL